jgi:hypothetical protein
MKSNYFKFLLLLLLDLVKSNPAKCITIFLSIITWNIAGTFSDVKYEEKIDQYIEISGTHLYISSDIKDNKIKYELSQYKEKQELIDNKLVWTEYSGWNVFFWVIFIISFGIWSISTLVGWFSYDNDDAGWDLKDSVIESLSTITYCEEENGIYYYLVMGRLIGKRDKQIRISDFRYEFGINSIRDILFCPKFKTKSQKRENLLSNIGIK